MASINSDGMSTDNQMLDGIGCAGTLLIMTLVIFTLAVGLGNARDNEPQTQSAKKEITTTQPAAGNQALAIAPISNKPALSTTIAPTVDSTDVPLATLISTSTAIPRPSQTPVPTATEFNSPTVVSTFAYLPEPLPTPIGVFSWTLKVPILMYHYVSIPPSDADEYRFDLSVSPENFRAQMDYLRDNGFTPVDLYDLTMAIVNQYELPENPVVITLDDGYRDSYENAYPILKEMGFKATIFIPTDFIDQENPNYLSWNMIEEMSAAGIRFEPHSKTHADLTEGDREFVVWQALGSQETLESHIGYRPRYFAYPGGRYDDQTIEVMSELDYWGAVTTEGGQWHGFNDRFEWKRLRIRNITKLDDFARLLD
jgi:peptidoglycan/xylan/chitin deacetylase (PgdA/CDA1 family)